MDVPSPYVNPRIYAAAIDWAWPPVPWLASRFIAEEALPPTSRLEERFPAVRRHTAEYSFWRLGEKDPECNEMELVD